LTDPLPVLDFLRSLLALFVLALQCLRSSFLCVGIQTRLRTFFHTNRTGLSESLSRSLEDQAWRSMCGATPCFMKSLHLRVSIFSFRQNHHSNVFRAKQSSPVLPSAPRVLPECSPVLPSAPQCSSVLPSAPRVLPECFVPDIPDSHVDFITSSNRSFNPVLLLQQM